MESSRGVVRASAWATPSLAGHVVLALALLAACALRSVASSPIRPDEEGKCPLGTSLQESSDICCYLVAVAQPYREDSRAVRVVGAYAAVVHVNSRDDRVVAEAAGLPDGFCIEPLLLDSEFSPSGGVNAALTARQEGVIAVVGPSRSSAAQPLANIMMVTRTPVVSNAASSPALSSESTFPLFSRTIPNDLAAAQSMARLMLENYSWRRLGIMYVDDTYGTSYFNAFLSGCTTVARDLDLQPGEYEVNGAALTLGNVEEEMADLKSRGVTVFALVIVNDLIKEFLEAAIELDMVGLGYTYITVDSDITKEVLATSHENRTTEASSIRYGNAMQGFLRVFFGATNETAEQDAVVDETVRTQVAAILPTSFVEAVESNGKNFSEWMDRGMQDDSFAQYAYDAMWTVALGLARAELELPDVWLKLDCGDKIHCNGTALNEFIRASNFSGVTGRVLFKSEGGDGADAKYLGDRDESPMSLPLQYFVNNDTMAWTDVGRMRPVDGFPSQKLELIRPIVWPGPTEAIPVDGSICLAGDFFNTSIASCLPCPVGTYTDDIGATECKLCRPGTYCSTPGCTFCESCESRTFQDMPAASSCQQCPNNTMTVVRGAVSSDACFCREGFYHPEGTTGQACFPCPNGAECIGGTSVPYARLGYWGDWAALLDSSEGALTDPSTLDNAYSFAFHRCTVESHCTNDCGLNLKYTAASGLSIEQAEALYECRNNTANLCDVKYTDTMCSRCSLNFFSLGGQCLTCREPAVLFVLGCMMMIILAWYLLNRIAAGRYEAVDLMLLFFQNASTISFFSLNWSKFLVEGPFWLLSIVNFDVDFFKPDCLNSQDYVAWTYTHSLVLQLSLPLLVAFYCIALYLVSTLVVRAGERKAARVAARAARPSPNPPALGRSLSRSLSNMAGRFQAGAAQASHAGWRAVGVATTRQELADQYDDSVATFTSFMNVIYHTLTAKCLEVFMCKSFADGSQFLITSPTISCWSSHHIAYIALAVVFFILYTVGIPLTFILILTYGKIHNLFRTKRFMRQFGWLYLRYDRSWYWWEATIMMRRGLLVVTLVLLQRIPSAQVIAGVSVIVSAITMHFFARPFISRDLDNLEQVSLLSLVGLLCTGILFYDEPSRLANGNWELSVTVLTMVCIFSALVMVVINVYHDVKFEEALARVNKRLRSDMKEVLDLHAPPAVERFQQRSARTVGGVAAIGKSIFRMGKSMFRMDSSDSDSDSDSGAVQSAPRTPTGSEFDHFDMWNITKEAIEKQPLEMHRTVLVHLLEGWLDHLVATSGEGTHTPASRKALLQKLASIHNLPRSMFKVKSGSVGSMLPTSDRRKIPPSKVQGGILRLWLANHWTHGTLSDTSPVSHYSQDSTSIFFANLVKENPFLLDYMLYVDETKFNAFKGVITDLRSAQLSFTKEGRIAKMIAFVDQGPLLAWMMVADHNHVVVIRRLLQEIFEANNDGLSPVSAEVQARDAESWRQRIQKRLLEKLPSPERFGLEEDSIMHMNRGCSADIKSFLSDLSPDHSFTRKRRTGDGEPTSPTRHNAPVPMLPIPPPANNMLPGAVEEPELLQSPFSVDLGIDKKVAAGAEEENDTPSGDIPAVEFRSGASSPELLICDDEVAPVVTERNTSVRRVVGFKSEVEMGARPAAASADSRKRRTNGGSDTARHSEASTSRSSGNAAVGWHAGTGTVGMPANAHVLRNVRGSDPFPMSTAAVMEIMAHEEHEHDHEHHYHETNAVHAINEEIARLSDFGSEVEEFLIDLERMISARVGAQSTFKRVKNAARLARMAASTR